MNPEHPEARQAPTEHPEEQEGHAGQESERGRPIGRRVLLGTLGLGALGVVAAPVLQRGLEAFLGEAADKDPTGLTGLLPNGGGFRYYSVTSSVPHKNAEELPPHRRRPGRPPATYTLADLRALPADPDGPGRPVRHRLAGARTPPSRAYGCPRCWTRPGCAPRPGAVRFTCFDGAYTESLTLDQARRADVLVALRMQDKDLGHAHGGPVRLYVAPMYFYKSAKWLSGITVTEKVRARLLGGAGLRRRRLGRPIERAGR